MAAIAAAGCRAYAEAALGEIQPISDSAAHAVVRNPFEQRGIDAPLQNEVFYQPPYLVFGESGSDGGAQSKTAPKSAGHVVFTAALPDLELSRGVDATFARIEAKHHFAEAQAVPAPRRIGNR